MKMKIYFWCAKLFTIGSGDVHPSSWCIFIYTPSRWLTMWYGIPAGYNQSGAATYTRGPKAVGSYRRGCSG